MNAAFRASSKTHFHWGSEGLRYTFNGKEKENEIAEGDLDFGARVYDSRLGRWMTMDPLASKYPSIASYVFALNSPIKIIDGDGQDIIVTGAASQDYLNLLHDLTGLDFTLDENNKLQFTYPVGGTTSNQPLIDKISTIATDPNTVVNINAVASSPDVMFDQDSRAPGNSPGAVDVGDFNKIADKPWLQVALMVHILDERANSTASFEGAHYNAMIAEVKALNSIFDSDIGLRSAKPSEDYLIANGLTVRLNPTDDVMVAFIPLFDYSSITESKDHILYVGMYMKVGGNFPLGSFNYVFTEKEIDNFALHAQMQGTLNPVIPSIPAEQEPTQCGNDAPAPTSSDPGSSSGTSVDLSGSN